MKNKPCLRCDETREKKTTYYRLCSNCRKYANDIVNSDKYYDAKEEQNRSQEQSLKTLKSFWNPNAKLSTTR